MNHDNERSLGRLALAAVAAVALSAGCSDPVTEYRAPPPDPVTQEATEEAAQDVTTGEATEVVPTEDAGPGETSLAVDAPEAPAAPTEPTVGAEGAEDAEGAEGGETVEDVPSVPPTPDTPAPTEE